MHVKKVLDIQNFKFGIVYPMLSFHWFQIGFEGSKQGWIQIGRICAVWRFK